MRYAWLTLVFSTFVVLGCSEEQPKVTRGSPPAGRSTKPAHAGNDQYALGEDAQEAFDEPGGVVRFGSLTLTPSEGWTRKPPQSSFIAAEFVLPRAAGDDQDGRLTLSLAGGSIEANVERWKGQFTGGSKNDKQEQFDVAGVKVTLVDLSGDFNDQRGPFAPGVQRKGFRMISAILPVGGQLHFIKGVGPEKTMAAHLEKIKAFIRSAQPKG
jgi:hypothetical protein